MRTQPKPKTALSSRRDPRLQALDGFDQSPAACLPYSRGPCPSRIMANHGFHGQLSYILVPTRRKSFSIPEVDARAP